MTKTTETLVALAVRVPANVRDKVETFRKLLEKERPGSSPSLSDAVRVLLLRGLEK